MIDMFGNNTKPSRADIFAGFQEVAGYVKDAEEDLCLQYAARYKSSIKYKVFMEANSTLSMRVNKRDVLVTKVEREKILLKQHKDTANHLTESISLKHQQILKYDSEIDFLKEQVRTMNSFQKLVEGGKDGHETTKKLVQEMSYLKETKGIKDLTRIVEIILGICNIPTSTLVMLFGFSIFIDDIPEVFEPMNDEPSKIHTNEVCTTSTSLLDRAVISQVYPTTSTGAVGWLDSECEDIKDASNVDDKANEMDTASVCKTFKETLAEITSQMEADCLKAVFLKPADVLEAAPQDTSRNDARFQVIHREETALFKGALVQAARELAARRENVRPKVIRPMDARQTIVRPKRFLDEPRVFKNMTDMGNPKKRKHKQLRADVKTALTSVQKTIVHKHKWNPKKIRIRKGGENVGENEVGSG